MNNTIAFQEELSYFGFEIKNHKDYFEYCSLIKRIDEILKLTQMDLHFADEYINKALKEVLESGETPIFPKQIARMTRDHSGLSLHIAGDFTW